MPKCKENAGHLGTNSVLSSTWVISISSVCGMVTRVPAKPLDAGLDSVDDEALQSRPDISSY